MPKSLSQWLDSRNLCQVLQSLLHLTNRSHSNKRWGLEGMRVGTAEWNHTQCRRWFEFPFAQLSNLHFTRATESMKYSLWVRSRSWERIIRLCENFEFMHIMIHHCFNPCVVNALIISRCHSHKQEKKGRVGRQYFSTCKLTFKSII